MATGKRYYWIKLKEDFFADDGPADFMMGQPDGANYVVLYQMLCLKTINTSGRLSNQIGEMIIPYDIEKIRRMCKYFTTDTVRIALNLFQALGLIYEDIGGTLVLAEHQNLVGSETDWADKRRRQRAGQPALPGDTNGDNVPAAVPAHTGDTPGDTNGDNVPAAVPAHTGDTPGDTNGDNVPTDIRDKDIRDLEIRDIDTRYLETRGKEEDSSCTEPQGAPVLTIILNDKSEYPIYQTDVEQWAELYPAVDVMQQLRNMKGWCISNPQKRKTKKGILKFINGWLAREQDRGGAYKQSPPASSTPRGQPAGTMAELRAVQQILAEEEGF